MKRIKFSLLFLTFCLICEAGFAQVSSGQAVSARLDSVFEYDQGVRRSLQEVGDRYGWSSEETRAVLQEMGRVDSLNEIEVAKILDEYGWLGPADVGAKGSLALFLVLQHGPLEMQEKYLPMMQAAVKKGDASAANLALLEDRVALRRGKLQIYGSQIGRDPETGGHYVLPLQDPDNVDKRRAEAGLPPLADYVSRWNINWDVEEYKRRLPELLEKN